MKVINSFSAESAEFLNCKAGELITLIAKDCHRYTVIICSSAFSLLPNGLAIKLPSVWFETRFHKVVSYTIVYFWYMESKYIRYVTNSRGMLREHWEKPVNHEPGVYDLLAFRGNPTRKMHCIVFVKRLEEAVRSFTIKDGFKAVIKVYLLFTDSSYDAW